jgi:predicted ATPase/class 3 adenylate cyclase
MAYESRTFMLTDLEASTELWDLDAASMSAALEMHDELIGRIVENAGGFLIQSKGEGDSTFSVFADPADSVEAARNVVSELAAAQWPTPRPLVARVGIHAGWAERRGVSWFGSTVNRAARIRGLAPAGAIFLSGTTADAVRARMAPGASLVMLGPRRLRGLRDREVIWAVVTDGDDAPRLVPDDADTNLERPHHELIGRAEDVDRVERLLQSGRLVTITGAGGTGKTRLAVEVAWRARPAHVDGVWMVDLAAVSTGAIVPLVLSTLGVPPSIGVDGLAERECVIVLDNCEHVVAEAAGAAVSVLRAAPRVKILATSRTPLGLAAETVFPLHPLTLPPDGASLRDLNRYPAFNLFIERAQQVDPSFTVAGGEAESVMRCLRMLDGMPLAIELAVPCIRTMSTPRLAQLLERDLPDVRTIRRDASDRHRSVASAIEWSLALLDPLDREALEALSVCRGFDAETVAAVSDRADAEAVLGRLVDASLVAPIRPDRFRLLEPVRQHAARALTARSGRDECLGRLTAHVQQRTQELARRLYTDPSVRLAFHDENGNVEQTFTWLLEQGFSSGAVRLAGALGNYWFTEAQGQGLRWLTRVEPLLDECEEREAAAARIALGMLRQGSGDACAIPQLTRALETYEAKGNLAGAAAAAFWLARELGIDEARPEPATRAACDRALDLAHRAHLPILVSWSMIWLGLLAKRRGDDVAEERHLREALDVALAADVAHPIGEILSNLSELARRRGDAGQARQLADRAVSACRRTGDSWQLLGTMSTRTWLCLWNGDLTQAALDVHESSELALRVGDEYRVALALASSAELLDAFGEREAAASAVRSLAHWLLTHWTNPGNLVSATVARHQATSSSDLPDAVAPPVRVELKAALEVLSSSGQRPSSQSVRSGEA